MPSGSFTVLAIPRPMLIAVDTNVLLDLALGVETIIDAIETIRKRLPSVRFVVPPTVLQELALLFQTGDTERQRKAAHLALISLREWKLEPLNLVPVGHGIVERIGDALRNEGLIPVAERNDSFVIAEAALIECGILLSSDAHLRNADFAKLSVLLQGFHVGAPIIATPREIVRKFCR